MPMSFLAVWLLAVVVTTFLQAWVAHGEIHQGAAVIVLAQSQRALLFGGGSSSGFFQPTITAIDLSNNFSTDAVPSTVLQDTLPSGARNLIPWVSRPGGGFDSEVVLFGGISGIARPSSAMFHMNIQDQGIGGVTAVRARTVVLDVIAPCSTSATAADGLDAGTTYLFGGYYPTLANATNTLRVLNSNKALSEVTISGGSPGPSPRSAGALTRIDANRLVLSGGISPSGSFLWDAWIFDIAASFWSRMPNLFHHRHNHQAVVVTPTGSSKSWLVLVGGPNAHALFEYAPLPTGTSSSLAWGYKNLTVSRLPSLHPSVVNHTVTVVGGDQIVLLGATFLVPRSANEGPSARTIPMSVIKVVETTKDDLSFEWVETFPRVAPPPAADSGPNDSPGNKETSVADNVPGPRAALVIAVVASVMAFLLVAVGGYVWVRRKQQSLVPSSSVAQGGLQPDQTVLLPQQPDGDRALAFAPLGEEEPGHKFGTISSTIYLAPPPAKQAPQDCPGAPMIPRHEADQHRDDEDELYLGVPPSARSTTHA